jgi:diguanylate cyclase (GGDEF)-like protein
MDSVKRILIISSDKNLLDVLNFCFDGWGYEVFLHETPLHEVGLIKKLSPDVVVVDVHAAHKSNLEICRIIKDDFFTSSIPVITLINKRQLRTQLLNIKQGVDDYLIKPPDPLDLRIRVEMALKRAQYSFYANPLTGLPGGRIIEETLKEKIKKEIPFSFGYIDIDNFKYFNDVYGYSKGDMAILQTAYMLYTVIRKYGNYDDFIGHIGGDDFMFITSVEKYQEICRQFIALFDRVTPYHYGSKDREQGFIVARDRTHTVKKIPLMSVTVAVVNKRNASELPGIVEVNERIAEIKRYLKTLPGSKFMADRRNILAEESNQPVVHKKEEKAVLAPKPLGQILVEENRISPQQLDEALRVHWKKGVILGEALKDLKLITQEQLVTALKSQESGLPSVISN